MLAARAGPQHVYAVVANENMADLATQLITANGLNKEITVINALSTHVQVGKVGVDRWHTHSVHMPSTPCATPMHAVLLYPCTTCVWGLFAHLY